MSEKCSCCSSTFFSCFSSKRKRTSDHPNDNTCNVISPTQEASPSAPPRPASTAEDASSSGIPVVVKQDDSRSQEPPSGGASSSSIVPALDAIHYPQTSPSATRSSTPHSAAAAVASSPTEDASSSGIPVVVKQDDSRSQEPPSGGASSSSIAPALDAIHQDVNAFQDGKLDVDWDRLVDHIDLLLKLIKENGKKSSEPKPTDWPWPTQSESIKKVKDFLSDAKDFVKDVPGDAKTIVRGVLQTMGTAHLAATGLLVISNVLQRFEDVSKNRDECLRLLKEMFFLAKVVKQIKDHPQLKLKMRDEVQDATELILDGCIRCYSQMTSSKISRFFSTTVNKEELAKLKQELDNIYKHLCLRLGIEIYDANQCKTGSLSRLYPQHAVGIEEAIREVIDILEWGSEQNAHAVVLHAFGGMGKSTLAQAVFSKLEIKECKYSKIELFKDINSSPNILELQKQILKDLMVKELPEMRNHQDGQLELARTLENVPAFIYIDNALGVNELQQLLPEDMSRAKKVRLLITARDKNVRKACPMKTLPMLYAVGCMSSTESTSLLKNEMFDDPARILDCNQVNYIIDKCGGIPLMLKLVARALRVAKDKPQEVREVMKDLENLKGEDFGANKIEPYFFVYDKLPEECKDPLLDICSFFHGWDRDTVADIVGDSELKMLESRALVTQDTNGVISVHDIILALGCEKSKGERYRFSNASQVKKLLDDMEDKDIQAIKGIWLTSAYKNTLDISASKLDLMYNSLRVLAFESLTSVKGKCTKIFQKLIFFKAEITHLPFDVSKLKGGLKYLNYKPKDLKLSEIPSSLRHVEFDGSLHNPGFQISSTDIQQLKNLRILKLINFAMLINLPDDMGVLVDGLQELCLSGCGFIKKLPKSISNLRSLRILRLESCHILKKLPTDLGLLFSLQELHLRDCRSLKELPNSIVNLSSLKILDLYGCAKLLSLPADLGNLTGLVKIDLTGCSSLESIPESIRELKLLQPTLEMSFCRSLKELPRGLCNLSYISHISLRYCYRLENLPDRFGELASLRTLNLGKCRTLKKLPESFGQLKCLEELVLKDCSHLRELCNDFHCLLSLQILDLSGCFKLQNLPADFHSLKSLQRLNIGDCHKLGGKWMDHVLKIKSLQAVDIEESQQLVNRWAEIQKEGQQSWSFAVSAGQDLAMSEDQKETIEKTLLSDFDRLLTNGRGEPFCLSDLPPNTLFLFVCDPYIGYWRLIEETLDEIQKQLQIIYIGPDFSEFPVKVKERIFVHHMTETRVDDVLEKVSLISDTDEGVRANGRLRKCFRMHTTMGDGEGDKYVNSWKLLTDSEVEEYVISHCRRYIRLKQLAETSQESNMELLRELFAPEEKEITDVFQRYHSEQDGTEDSEPFICGVDKLEGKNIILEMRPVDLCNDIRLSSLEEMYLMEKERLELEIISIPIVEPRTQMDPIVEPRTQMDLFDVHTQLSRKVPWLVLQNSWDKITRVVKYFLLKQCGWEGGDELEKCYTSMIWIIEFNGKITIYKPSLFHKLDKWKILFNYLESLAYQVKWGTKVRGGEKIEELRREEWKQLTSMSTLEFIFNHLGSVSNQVKEMMFQGKMICLLYNGADRWRNEEVTTFLLNSMTEVTDNIHIIYISGNMERFSLTDSITKHCYNSSGKTVKMDGMTLLNVLGDEAVKFSMRLLQWKDEINENDYADHKQFCEMRRLLLSFALQQMDEPMPYIGCMIFMYEDGNMFATCRNAILSRLFHFNNKREDKLKGWMQLLVKVLMEEEKERHHESSSFCNVTNSIQTAATAIKPETVDLDLDLDSLIQYTSDLLEQEELYQLLEFNKEGKRSSRPKARHHWPTSEGFSMLKNFLSKGISATWVEDIVSGHPEEDKWKSVTKRLLKELGEAQWAAAGLLIVAEVLERFDTVSTNRNECLFLLDHLNRLAIYVKQFKERSGSWTVMMREATGSIVVGSIICCAQIDPSKFAMFVENSMNDQYMISFQLEFTRKCETMAYSINDGLASENESHLEEMCKNAFFDFVTGDLENENENIGGPSAERESDPPIMAKVSPSVAASCS